MGSLKQFIKRRGIFVLMLLAGLYYGCLALWNLSNTLLYVHESQVVTATVKDVRQRPFESYTEALRYGNLPWNGDIAYKPILAFSMPGGFRTRALTAPDLDNTDYTRGEQLELIAHPLDPTHCHVYKWKFLWGADCMLLGFALALGVPAWLVLFPRRKRRAAAPKAVPRKTRPSAPSPTPRTTTPRPTPAPKPVEDTPFLLPEETPAPKKPRAPRKKKETDPNAPKKPRAPRKKKEVDPNAPPKPRKPRKKKEAP